MVYSIVVNILSIFSNRLWYCMSQYGEITPMLVTTLPSFRGLTSLNIAHIATDQLVATISRHLANLLSLNVSGSEVTDDAIRFIAGMSIEQTCKRGLTGVLYGEYNIVHNNMLFQVNRVSAANSSNSSFCPAKASLILASL